LNLKNYINSSFVLLYLLFEQNYVGPPETYTYRTCIFYIW